MRVKQKPTMARKSRRMSKRKGGNFLKSLGLKNKNKNGEEPMMNMKNKNKNGEEPMMNMKNKNKNGEEPMMNMKNKNKNGEEPMMGGAEVGVSSCGVGKKNNAAVMGGRRKTRKMSKGASEWTSKVVKLYEDMKAKDKNVKFGDALKAASKLKKAGKL